MVCVFSSHVVSQKITAPPFGAPPLLAPVAGVKLGDPTVSQLPTSDFRSATCNLGSTTLPRRHPHLPPTRRYCLKIFETEILSHDCFIYRTLTVILYVFGYSTVSILHCVSKKRDCIFNSNLNKGWLIIIIVILVHLSPRNKPLNFGFVAHLTLIQNCQTLKSTNHKAVDIPTATMLRYVTCKIVTMIMCLIIIQIPCYISVTVKDRATVDH